MQREKLEFDERFLQIKFLHENKFLQIIIENLMDQFWNIFVDRKI